MPYESGERRPIASRDRTIFRSLAHQLAIWKVSANTISAAGMVAGLLSGLAFGSTSNLGEFVRLEWVLGAVFVQIRLLANMLDGMVAIETRTASPVGELFNEVPDRISDSAVLIGLGYAVGGDVRWGIGAACAAMFTAYIRAVGKVAGAPQEFCGPMAKPHRMFLVTLLALFMGCSPVSWQWAGGVPKAVLIIITVGSLLTAVRRLYRSGRALITRSSNG